MMEGPRPPVPDPRGADPTGGVGSGLAGVQARLQEVLRPIGWARVARMIGCNAETLRRQCTSPSGRPTLETLCGVCAALDLNANWVLFGVGPRHGRDLRTQMMSAVGSAGPGEVYVYVGVPVEAHAAASSPDAVAQDGRPEDPGPDLAPRVQARSETLVRLVGPPGGSSSRRHRSEQGLGSHGAGASVSGEGR